VELHSPAWVPHSCLLACADGSNPHGRAHADVSASSDGGSQSLAAAAAKIASIVTCGFETIDTWEPSASVIVAPARSAMLL